MEEYHRRLTEEAMRFYKPHGQQLPFHSRSAEVESALLSGSNQCGKSRALRHDIQITVGKVNPWRKNYSGPVYARHCCADFQVMQSVVIPGYKEEVPREQCKLDWLTFEGRPAIWPGLRGGKWESAWSAEARTLFLADGSLIEFKSYEQENLLSWAGPPRHIIAFDEEPPQFIYKECVARQATTGRNEIFAFTPLNYSQWLYDMYEQAASNPKIAAYKMSMYDNPLIAVETIRSIEESIDDPAERAARIYGDFTYSEGRVWKGYGAHNIIDPFVIPTDWHRVVVIDPHLEKATGVNAFAIADNGKSYCYYEADIKGDVQAICDQLKSDLGGQQVNTWIIDPASKQSASIHGKGRLIDEFRKYIPYLIEANNSHELGIAAVANLVKDNPTGGPKLFIMANCTTTDYQMRNYSFKPPLKDGSSRTKPEVVKRNDEHCDCIRYFAMYSRTGVEGNQFGGFEVKAYGNG